jgi:hypothetical protein
MFEGIPRELRPILIGVLVFAAIKAFFFVLIAVTCFRERRLVMPYRPVGPDEALPETPYVAATNRLAASMEFAHLGTFHDAKGRIYQVRYELWTSPQLDLFAVVGGGTIARLPLEATWLYSRLADGRAVVTTDALTGVELITNGLAEGGLCLNADLFELAAFHRRIVAETGQAAVPFDPSDPIGDLVALRRGMVDLLVEDGVATYFEEGRESWHYTLRGALRRASRGQRRAAQEAKRNAGRNGIKRPGAAGYIPSWERTV